MANIGKLLNNQMVIILQTEDSAGLVYVATAATQLHCSQKNPRSSRFQKINNSSTC